MCCIYGMFCTICLKATIVVLSFVMINQLWIVGKSLSLSSLSEHVQVRDEKLLDPRNQYHPD